MTKTRDYAQPEQWGVHPIAKSRAGMEIQIDDVMELGSEIHSIAFPGCYRPRECRLAGLASDVLSGVQRRFQHGQSRRGQASMTVAKAGN